MPRLLWRQRPGQRRAPARRPRLFLSREHLLLHNNSQRTRSSPAEWHGLTRSAASAHARSWLVRLPHVLIAVVEIVRAAGCVQDCAAAVRRERGRVPPPLLLVWRACTCQEHSYQRRDVTACFVVEPHSIHSHTRQHALPSHAGAVAASAASKCDDGYGLTPDGNCVKW